MAEPAVRVLVASEVAPSLKMTVPVGVPLPGEAALTVAVKVTDWPKTEGLPQEVKPTVLADLFTTCVSAAEVLVL